MKSLILAIVLATSSSAFAASFSDVHVKAQFELKKGLTLSGQELVKELGAIISTTNEVLYDETQKNCHLVIDGFTPVKQDLTVTTEAICRLYGADENEFKAAYVQLRNALEGRVSEKTGVEFKVSNPGPNPGGTVHN